MVEADVDVDGLEVAEQSLAFLFVPDTPAGGPLAGLVVALREAAVRDRPGEHANQLTSPLAVGIDVHPSAVTG